MNATGAPPEPGGLFVEPLTFRELEVLRLLPSHRSYREIGAELYVSVNTVKYHVKAIYRKLGADGRADAARIAEQSGMVATSA
jgi:LuxR family maltose regulon positive regulatory protein